MQDLNIKHHDKSVVYTCGNLSQESVYPVQIMVVILLDATSNVMTHAQSKGIGFTPERGCTSPAAGVSFWAAAAAKAEGTVGKGFHVSRLVGRICDDDIHSVPGIPQQSIVHPFSSCP